MRKRKPQPQVNCYCSQYSFPHRLGGGRCNSEDWAEAYYIYVSRACLQCNNNHNGCCDVAGGAEPITECEAYREVLHTERDPKPQLLREGEHYV